MIGTANAGYQAYNGSNSRLTGVAKTIALYDEAICHLAEARDKWHASAFEAAFHAVQRAAAIVAVLSASLDDRKGKPLGETLRRYYTGLSFQIAAAPRQRDPVAHMDSLLRQIRTVRDAWAQVLSRQLDGPVDIARMEHGTNSGKLA